MYFEIFLHIFSTLSNGKMGDEIALITITKQFFFYI